jgi:hypothetical protein
MNIIRKLVLACSAVVLTSGSVGAQCTAETETGRRLVLGYATQHTNARPAGVPVVTAQEVRPLTNTYDSATCSQLFNVFWGQWRNPEEAKPGWRWTYYQVGTLYYVVAHPAREPVMRNPDGTLNISLRWSPIFVIDRNYQLVASIAR